MSDINWSLIERLKGIPHPNLPYPGPPDLPTSIGEVLQQAKIAQHLLDLANIPLGEVYARDVDARVYLAVRKIQVLTEQLDRISARHARETGPAGTVGDYCVTCGEFWPCDTYRLATGEELDDEECLPSTPASETATTS